MNKTTYKMLMNWRPLSPEEMARLTNSQQQVVRVQPVTNIEQPKTGIMERFGFKGAISDTTRKVKNYEFAGAKTTSKKHSNLPEEFEFGGSLKTNKYGFI